MEERIEGCLGKVAAKIVLDAAAQERILKGVKAKKYSRKKLARRHQR